MKTIISAIAFGMSLYTTPTLTTSPQEGATIEYRQTILGPRCEIRDPSIGFYAKGNCDKVINAYERYKIARAMQ